MPTTIQSKQMKQTNWIVFLCGDISTTLYVFFAGIVNDFGHFMLNLVAILITGAAGGLAGMAGKELWPVIKKYFKRKLKKKTSS